MSTEQNLYSKLKKDATGTPHLRQLLLDKQRSLKMKVEYDNIQLDFSHQKLSSNTLNTLTEYATHKKVQKKVQSMFSGEHINSTENRPVMHVALRSKEEDQLEIGGEKVYRKVNAVLTKIKTISDSIRSGNYRLSGESPVKDVLVIGIGGSYLGVEAVYQAMESFLDCQTIKLHFLANVDPIAFHRACGDLDPATTLAVVISKTFTTAETMLNACIVKDWFRKSLLDKGNISKHFFAISSSPTKCKEFGISIENVFEIWDWVGGRFSVTSAVGVLPLSLCFGFAEAQNFLNGARSVDRHFLNTPVESNLPVLMGLLGVWNSEFLGHQTHAIVPYSEALRRFPAHIQQVDMESNGKRVNLNGDSLPKDAGEIVLGEPGTNAQHSFFQLMHQGRVIPVDFVGYVRCAKDITLGENSVSSHDELMSNFFAQADALALGQGNSNGHKEFRGDRPSMWILFRDQTSYSIGQLVALYEHRVAVQGFLWDINSFDQFGVQLGKDLGKNVRGKLEEMEKMKRKAFGEGEVFDQMTHSSTQLLLDYVKRKRC